MKRLVSLITIMALMFQLTAFSSFAAADKTVFTAVTEVYGVYVIDKNYTNLSVFSAKKLEHVLRDYNTTKFYTNTTDEFKATSTKYTLSKDKKTVNVKVVYADKSVSDYALKKDKNGKVYMSSTDEEGIVSKYPKAYATLDLATQYVKSDKFKATLKLESELVKKIDTFNADTKEMRSTFYDMAPISETNLIEGFYLGATDDEYLDICFNTYFDKTTYQDFAPMLETYINVAADEDYYLYAFTYKVEGDIMTVLEDDNNYISFTATDRSTINHIKIVIDGKTVYDKDVNYHLATKYTS